MAAAHSIDYPPEASLFELPAEHAGELADENSPYFSAGIVEGTIPHILMMPRMLGAFRDGKGILYSDYLPEVFEATERMNKPDYRTVLESLSSSAVVEAPPILGRERDCLHCRCACFSARAGIWIRAIQAQRCASSRERAVCRRQRPYDLITINYSLHRAGNPPKLLRSTGPALAAVDAFLSRNRFIRMPSDCAGRRRTGLRHWYCRIGHPQARRGDGIS